MTVDSLFAQVANPVEHVQRGGGGGAVGRRQGRRSAAAGRVHAQSAAAAASAAAVAPGPFAFQQTGRVGRSGRDGHVIGRFDRTVPDAMMVMVVVMVMVQDGCCLLAGRRRPRTAPDADEICVAIARQFLHVGVAF